MSYHAIQPVRLSGWPALGTLMRTNPLPAGRYWIDVFGDKRALLAAWFKQNASSVRAENTDGAEATSTNPAWDFYIFSVSSPTPWDSNTFGYPTIAGSNVHSSEDTITAPPLPKDGTDTLSDFFDSLFHSASDAGSAAKSISFWVAVAVGGVLVLKVVEMTGVFRSRSKS